MSYFPEDIPFMSKEELRENGIRIPKDATDIRVGDTISRQAAIDAINSWRGRFSEEYNEAIDDCENSIIKLPTIQPEVLACGNGELIAKPEPQWIPCEDCERRCKRWENLKTLQE